MADISVGGEDWAGDARTAMAWPVMLGRPWHARQCVADDGVASDDLTDYEIVSDCIGEDSNYCNLNNKEYQVNSERRLAKSCTISRTDKAGAVYFSPLSNSALLERFPYAQDRKSMNMYEDKKLGEIFYLVWKTWRIQKNLSPAG